MVTESGFSPLSLPPSDEYLECTVMLRGAARTRTKTKGHLPVSPFLPDFLLKKCLAANQLPPPPLLAKGCLSLFSTEMRWWGAWAWYQVQIRLVKCSADRGEEDALRPALAVNDSRPACL